MSAAGLLALYLALRFSQQAVEHALAALNQRYASDPDRLAEAGRILRIAPGEMEHALAYARDRHRFGLASEWADVAVGLTLLAAGALGAVDAWARAIASSLGLGAVGAGLAFFAILGGAATVFALPFGLYHTFVIEERHGFNRQTVAGFLADLAKGLALSVALGGSLLAALLAIMERMGPGWWLWAWAATSAFGLFAAWIYPTLLAPLFNRFTPLPEGELRDRILALAERIGFRAGGLFVMDASRRTAHGNAYFTGLFRQKRIVLFDTLLDVLAPGEVVAVLAHELGHFKLHHVRARILRSTLATGALFLGISLCLPLRVPYEAFALTPSSHAALVVFGLWFGLLAFLAQPVGSALSRRQEFAADAFAMRSGAPAAELAQALLKLREKSRLLPLSHPLYSWLYHSHPPLLERLRALGEAR